MLQVEWPSVGQYDVHNCAMYFFKNQLLERHPFSGRCDSAGELLHTPYADSYFHGHRPAFGTTRNTLSVYRKVGADNVRPAYLESVRFNPSSTVLLTKYGTLRFLDII